MLLGSVGDKITTGVKVELHGVIEAVVVLGGCPAYVVRYGGGATGVVTHGPATIIEPVNPVPPPGGRTPLRGRRWQPARTRAAAHQTRRAEVPR